MMPALGRPAVGNREAAGASNVTGDGVHYLGLKPSSGVGAKKLTVPLSAAPLSTSVDLSSQLPPVGNQGNQGSCVAWSTSYYYKSWSEKQEHTGWDLNNAYYQYSPSFMYNQINGGYDNGATFQNAFALLQNTGDVDIAEMPYSSSNWTNKPTAAQLEAAKPYRIPSNWSYFWLHSGWGPYSSSNDITGVKTWLDSGKMLVMAFPVYTDFPNYGSNPTNPYYVYNGTSGLAGGHGVCICGYDDNANPSGADADHRGGFKMVNSWGPSWNTNGFVYLSYDFVKRYVREAWSMSDLSPDGPSISSLNPSSGVPGNSVTIMGSNFGTLRRQAKVSFNGVNATSPTFTNASIVATVPTGATTGPLTVYDWDGKASNSVTFTVGFGVTSITPTTGTNNGTVNVTIGGNGFVAGTGAGASLKQSSSSTVINGTSFVVKSPTQITCTFDLNGKPVGTYDVVVVNGDGKVGTYANGFTVSQAVVCGSSSGASVSVFAATLGLMSLAGLGLRRRKRHSK